MKPRLLLLVLAVLAFATSTRFALSQATLSFAQLNGAVVDTGGRTIAKAAITVRQVDTNQTSAATSNDSGFFVIPNLPPGAYELSFGYRNCDSDNRGSGGRDHSHRGQFSDRHPADSVSAGQWTSIY